MMDEVSTATDAKRVKTTSAQRRMRVNQIGARLHRHKRWRGATEEQKAAEMKDKVQTDKKSLEEQQHRNNMRCSNTKIIGRLQQKKPQLRHAVKEVAERKAKARQQTRPQLVRKVRWKLTRMPLRRRTKMVTPRQRT